MPDYAVFRPMYMMIMYAIVLVQAYSLVYTYRGIANYSIVYIFLYKFIKRIHLYIGVSHGLGSSIGAQICSIGNQH